jgi:hypothetical protein
MATPTNLPASFTAGSILTATQQNALRGAFRILQVVQATTTSQTSSTSSTYANTALSCAITPQSTTSKIFVLVDGIGFTSLAGSELSIRLTRDQPSAPTVLQTTALAVFSAVGAIAGNYNFTYLDSPSSLSSITYRTQLARGGGSGGVVYDEVNLSVSTMTLFEVSA